MELVVCIFCQEIEQNLQREFCGIEACTQWKKHKERGIQNSKLEKEKEPITNTNRGKFKVKKK